MDNVLALQYKTVTLSIVLHALVMAVLLVSIFPLVNVLVATKFPLVLIMIPVAYAKDVPLGSL